MPGILDTLLGVKHGEKLRQERAQMGVYGPIAHSYLMGDQSITDDVGEHAVGGVAKLLPTEEKKRFLAFVEAAKHSRQLAQQPQQKPPNQFQQGSPAPQVSRVPGNFQSAPTEAERRGLGPLPALPQSPEGSEPVSQSPVPLPQPPEVSAPPAPAQPAPQATPAPQQSQPPVQPIATTSLTIPGQVAPIGQGFGSAVNPPPVSMPPAPGPLLRYPYETARQRGRQALEDKYGTEYDAKMRELTGVSAFNRGQEKQIIAERIDALKRSGDWDKLSPRQKAELQIGAKQITPERAPMNVPGMVKGVDIPDGVDAFGNAIEADSMYRVRIDPSSGVKEFFPQLAMTTSKVLPDNNSPTGFSLVFFDRTGAEVSRKPGATPPTGFSPTVTTNERSSTQVRDIGGQMVPVTLPSSSKSTRVRVLPGQQQLPATPTGGTGAPVTPSTAPVTMPARPTGGGGARVGASLGPSGSEQRRLEEQPLTADAAKNVREITPMLERIKRLKKAMEPFKNSNTPAEMFIPRLAYTLGMDKDNLGGFLSELEMDSLISAARVTKGTSRSANVLSQGQIHTARAWKDSGKLMHEKLTTIERALTEILKANEGPAAQKYPGLNRTGQPAPAAMPDKPKSRIKILSVE